MKLFITILFLIQSIFSFSQEKEMLNILNSELKKEIRYQKVDAVNYYGEKFEVVKNFSIKDSILTMTSIKADGTEDALMQTEMKILSLEIRKKNPYKEGFYIQKQEVELRKIKAIAKDINILFETEPDAVKVTNTDEEGEKTVIASDLFFLQLSYEKHNEGLAEDLIKAFAKTGYKILKGSWYD